MPEPFVFNCTIFTSNFETQQSVYSLFTGQRTRKFSKAGTKEWKYGKSPQLTFGRTSASLEVKFQVLPHEQRMSHSPFYVYTYVNYCFF